MIKDYNKEEFQVLPNFKGGEKEMNACMFFDGKCRFFKASLAPGVTISATACNRFDNSILV